MTTRTNSSRARSNSSTGSKRGFAAMSASRRREIASMGGRASHGGHGGRSSQDNYDYEDERSSSHSRGGGRSRQGFASMPREEQREISSMGGRASRGGYGRSHSDYEDEDYSTSGRGRRSSQSDYEDEGYSDGRGGRSRQGFASMPREEQREISSMGGRASHGGRGRSYDSYDSDYDDDNYSSDNRRNNGRGRQGFASMSREEQREISSMGGRASHGGRENYNSDYDEDNYESDYNDNNRGRYSDYEEANY